MKTCNAPAFTGQGNVDDFVAALTNSLQNGCKVIDKNPVCTVLGHIDNAFKYSIYLYRDQTPGWIMIITPELTFTGNVLEIAPISRPLAAIICDIGQKHVGNFPTIADIDAAIAAHSAQNDNKAKERVNKLSKARIITQSRFIETQINSDHIHHRIGEFELEVHNFAVYVTHRGVRTRHDKDIFQEANPDICAWVKI